MNTQAPADDILDRFRASMRSLTALPELDMRVASVGRRLHALSPEDAVWWLGQTIRGALWGVQSSMDGMLATSLWLLRTPVEDIYSWCQDVYAVAHAQQRREIMYLLRDAPPFKALGDGARLPEVRLPMNRDVSLGERRQLARTARGDLLDRLLYDPNPLVLENLLENTSLRTERVLIVASRRPTTPELLDTIALHRTWVTHQDLREALVMNPFVRTGVALKFTCTLNLKVLRRVRDSRGLHPSISELAGLLVDLREERTAPLRV